MGQLIIVRCRQVQLGLHARLLVIPRNLHIYTAQKVSGEIRYRSGRAQFYRGRLDYSGLEDANAETFWFR